MGISVIGEGLLGEEVRVEHIGWDLGISFRIGGDSDTAWAWLELDERSQEGPGAGELAGRLCLINANDEYLVDTGGDELLPEEHEFLVAAQGPCGEMGNDPITVLAQREGGGQSAFDTMRR